MSLLDLNSIRICNEKNWMLRGGASRWRVPVPEYSPGSISVYAIYYSDADVRTLFLKSALCNWPFIKTLTEPQQQSSTLLSSGKLKGLYQVHTGVSLTSVCHKFISVYTQSQKQTKVITFKQRSLASSGVCKSQEQYKPNTEVFYHVWCSSVSQRSSETASTV